MNARKRALGLALVAAATVVLWQTGTGRYVLYPFTILATWFHEMGHGLAAMLLGGSFVELRLFSNGSGYAVYSAPESFARPAVALVAAAGPAGPAFAGALLILASMRARWSRSGLAGLAFVMLASVVLWMRTVFGIAAIGSLALVLLLVALRGNEWWRALTLQVIGVQACISLFLQVGYLFTEQVRMSGRLVYTDTGQMARALFLPYWIWAVLLTGLTLWLPIWSLGRVFRMAGISRSRLGR